MTARGPRTPPPVCTAPGCRRAAVAKGLCLMHYKRRRAGKPLVPAGPVVGSVSGHGLYGVLDDDGDTVGCHECGRRVRMIGPHLQKAHPEISAADYRAAHGLPRTMGLVSASLRAQRSALASARVGTPAWARLEAARDPAAAAAARGPDSFTKRAPTLAAHLENAAPAGGAAVRRTTETQCATCPNRWLPAPGQPPRLTCSTGCLAALRSALSTRSARRSDPARTAQIHAAHRSGQPVAAIATEHGITPRRVHQLLAGFAADQVGDHADPACPPATAPGDAR